MTVIELPVTPPAVALMLVELVNCLCEELATGGGGPTCWCGLYPGAAVSYDYCGVECNGEECGMGYVRLGGAFPYEVFPIPAIDERCTRPVAYPVEVGALRCFPLLPDGELPDPATMADVTMRQLLDSQAIHAALRCCATSLDIAIEAYRPVGPEGSCVGGYWTAYLGGP